MDKKIALLQYIIISLLYVTFLSHAFKGIALSLGAFMLFVLFTGAFCYFSLKKPELFKQKPLFSAAMSIPFLFLIIFTTGVNDLSITINFANDIWSSLSLMSFIALLLSLILLFIFLRSFALFHHPMDIALIAAVIFILLFSPLTHSAGITPEQKDLSVDFPLYLVLVKVLVAYFAINILLRQKIFIKPLLILLLISLGIILVLP
jgi:hypothetical protein